MAHPLTANPWTRARTFLPRPMALASGFLDLLYPRSCIDCGEPVEEEGRLRFVCSACLRRIPVIQDPCCHTCGYPYFGKVDDNRTCPHCIECRPRFREGRAAVLMQGPGRLLVHGLKYRGAVHLVEDIQALFRATGRILPFLSGAALVPVPLHPRKERERGFNQSSLIARGLARDCGGAAVVPALVRIRDTESQTHFDRKQRQANLKNAFAIAPGCSLNPLFRYVLVDDVFTTGSTLNACAAVLRKAGINNLDVVTFGHG